MALKQSLRTQFAGVMASYWRISDDTEVRPRSKVAQVVLNGYVDQESANEDLDRVASREFMIVGADFDKYVTGKDMRSGMYKFVKLQDDFSDAEDV